MMNGELVQVTSIATFGRFTNTIHAGEYFCEVILDGSTASFFPSIAQSFTEETDALLNENPCGFTGFDYTQSIMRCAGNTSYSTTSMLQPSSAITSSSSLHPISDSDLKSLGRTTISQSQASRPALSLWIHVSIGVMVVFFSFMIIIVVTVVCIVLCFKKNKAMDFCRHEFSIIISYM